MTSKEPIRTTTNKDSKKTLAAKPTLEDELSLAEEFHQSQFESGLISAGAILQLQRTIGNHAVQHLLGSSKHPPSHPITITSAHTQSRLQNVIQLARGKLIKNGWGNYFVVDANGDTHKIDKQYIKDNKLKADIKAALNGEVEYELNGKKVILNKESLKNSNSSQPPALAKGKAEEAPVTPQEIDAYQAAWQKARHYHGTSSLDDVKESGLDPKFGDSRAGANDAEANKKGKVFVAQQNAANISLTYGNNDPENVTRPIFGRNRTDKVRGDRALEIDRMNPDLFKNLPEGDRLIRDPNMGGAFFTVKPIPHEEIVFGLSRDLIKSPNAARIFSLIQEHYEGPKPSIERLKLIHTAAVNAKRISNSPGDQEETFKKVLSAAQESKQKYEAGFQGGLRKQLNSDVTDKLPRHRINQDP